MPAVHLSCLEAFNTLVGRFVESLQNSGSGIVETNLLNFNFLPSSKTISFFF